MLHHTSNLNMIKEIQEHALVPGNSHDDLWLGPNVIFKPGTTPEKFHFFFSVSDRTGGDSIQNIIHFTAPPPPENSELFSTWYKKWKQCDYPKNLKEITNEKDFRFVPSFNWKYHAASGKAIGFGHVLRHKGSELSNHLEHCAVSYSIFDFTNDSFTPWSSFRIKTDGEFKSSVAYGERVDLPNGDIILPFSTIKELDGWNSIRWCGSARCRLEGESINIIAVGNLVTHPEPRGFVEPSMIENNGTFYMTLRAQDGYSHVTTSEDGLTWKEPHPWCWDNGTTIPMEQTMTKFVSCANGVFLVYTRITDDNSNVFRRRAPLFIAQIDTQKVCLIRETESILLANNGFPLGNFNIHEVSPNEVWITAPEWDRTGRNIACDNRLAKVIRETE